MAPYLRSLIQFASLERKFRNVSKADGWQARVWQLGAPSIVRFETMRLAASPETGRLDAVRMQAGVEAIRRIEKPVAELGIADLVEIGEALLGQKPAWRTTGRTAAVAGHSPLDPVLVQAALERFLEWVRSPAFAEMHPVEQMTLCVMRLYEISPFASLSDVVSDFFALLVLHRRNGLVPLFEQEDAAKFPAALSAAFGFDTKGLVELNARACERVCDEVLRQP